MLNKFGSFKNKIEFGDYLLFQEYSDNGTVSKPILAIYLGYFVADQTIGFNYVQWNNEHRTVYITNEYVKKYPVVKQVKEIQSHIEWGDSYIDILGHWIVKPSWKLIIKAYRKQKKCENTQT